MKQAKRILSVLLVLIMMLVLTVPAFAAKERTYPDYKVYMCLGDSISAGCALSREDGVEYPYDENIAKVADDPEAYLAYLTYMYSPDCDAVYRGYSPEPVPCAYHSLVAKELGAELIQGGRSGMRAIELRYMLDGVYNEPDATYEWGNTYFQMNDDGVFTLEDLDLVNAQYNYVENIKRSDLISINLGSNDVISPSFAAAFTSLTADTQNEELKEIRDFFNRTGNLGAAFSMLVGFYETIDKLAVVVDTLTDKFNATIKLFKENYDAIIKAIYAYNPDVTVVGVGTYNIFKDFKLSSDSKFNISVFAQPFVNDVNTFIKSYEHKHIKQYFYADVVGTETYEVVYNDPHMWDLWIFKVHPDLAGHKYMAEQILDALDRADSPLAPFPVVSRYSSLLSKLSSKIYDTFMQLFARILNMDIQFGNISFGR